jgi:hypothetical protein
MQVEVFPINLVLKIVVLPQIHVQSAKPDWSELDHKKPNQGIHCHIM